MSYEETIRNAYSNPPEGLEIIMRVSTAHRSAPDMMDYTFFREQAAFALFAIDALNESGEKLNKEQQMAADYCNNYLRRYFY